MRWGDKHMYAYICPVCGAYLDPGENCDCRDEEKAAQELALQRRHEKITNNIIPQKRMIVNEISKKILDDRN